MIFFGKKWTFFAKFIFEKNDEALKGGEVHEVSVLHAQNSICATESENSHFFKKKCILKGFSTKLHVEYSTVARIKYWKNFPKPINFTDF